MQTPEGDPAGSVNASSGQGVAVGSQITQHNYFMGSGGAAVPRSGRSQNAHSGRLRVFISSASGALAPYRAAAVEVCHRLGHVPVHMEDFDPQRPPPENVCRAEVEGCDLLVLLLAHRYGDRPPGQELSYTELEYQWAAARPRMGLLAFVVDPAFPWPPPDIDHGADAAALARLVTEVRSRHLVRQLAEVAAFREDLIFALSRQDVVPPPAVAAGEGEEAGEPGQQYQPPAPPAFHAVPVYVGSAPFTGRSEYLAELDDWGRSADPVMVVDAIGGTGKSALTWQWAQDQAPAAIPGLAGRLWWSFYDGSASMTRFLQELLGYVTGRPMKQVRHLERADLADEVLVVLRSRPYLIVLDGFERLLAAYHRFDPSKLRDDEVEPDKRSLIESSAEDVVGRLAAAGPSKILISSRLMPLALQGRFGRYMDGVRQLRLPGLTDPDTRLLLTRLGVTGSEQAIAGFFGPLGNHPLLVGIVAGLVRDYRADPGGFDRWLVDPTAGAALSVPDLDLVQRRTHILAAALSGLPSGSRRLLGWISVLPGAVRWDTLTAINPFRPEPPAPVEPELEALGPVPYAPNPFDYRPPSDDYSEWPQYPGEEAEAADPEQKSERRERDEWLAAATELRAQAARDNRERFAAWLVSEPVLGASAQLDAALRDLENRGLLWWDRSSNTYDLHPIIRAQVHDQLEDTDRVQANDRVRDHFQALPAEDPQRAASVEDLSQTITIFRALVGAGHFGDANSLWTGFGNTLLVDLGANATVIELLAPLAAIGAPRLRGNLSTAYRNVGRYDDAIRLNVGILADALKSEDPDYVERSLGNLSLNFLEVGSVAAASRCIELRAAVTSAADDENDGQLSFDRSTIAAGQGHIELAAEFLDQAEERGAPANAPWFNDDVIFRQLELAVVVDEPLSDDDLDAAAARSSTWSFRQMLVSLRCHLLLRDGQYEAALGLAQEFGQLCRNAGIDIPPARIAFILAKLGRISESAVAVDDAESRLSRIHPAQRPHYFIAKAQWELGRSSEAVSHALRAYQQAWADGPPNSNYWRMREARELLETVGEPVPELPITDPSQVQIPLEAEVRAFIAELQAENAE
jgi:hypothetical protein